MSDKKYDQAISDPDPPAAYTKGATAGKPIERLQVTVEFDKAMDHAALGELLDAIKLYGKVTVAKHTVLRRHSRELV